jgi:hypothetical protein
MNSLILEVNGNGCLDASGNEDLLELWWKLLPTILRIKVSTNQLLLCTTDRGDSFPQLSRTKKKGTTSD